MFLPGAVAAIRSLNDAGRLVIVVTNQAGIARGYFSEADTHKFHAAMQRALQAEGAHIDGFFFCPHHPDFSPPCSCRKPATGNARIPGQIEYTYTRSPTESSELRSGIVDRAAAQTRTSE
jgi:D-glycero-D-manno-heptose 1,7-bisphosphate phosphatase